MIANDVSTSLKYLANDAHQMHGLKYLRYRSLCQINTLNIKTLATTTSIQNPFSRHSS